MTDQDKIWVVTADSLEDITRGPGERLISETQIDVKQLSGNVNIFLGEINNMLKDAPERVGNFQFDEFEIYAEVSAEGTLKMLGTGVGISGTGGLKFVFRRK